MTKYIKVNNVAQNSMNDGVMFIKANTVLTVSEATQTDRTQRREINALIGCGLFTVAVREKLGEVMDLLAEAEL